MRPLHEIARQALSDDSLKGCARAFSQPYLAALTLCEKASDRYIFEDAKTQIVYALSNLQSWRGDSARAIKAELKAHLA